MTTQVERTAAPTGDARGDEPRSGGRQRLPVLLGRVVRAPEFGAAVAAVLLYVAFAIAAAGNGFTTIAGTASWLDTAASLGIIAVPLGLLMMAGDFDLSIGSMVGAGSVTVGIVVGHFHESLLLAIVAAAGIALAVGLGNGLLVTRTRLPSFIVTLASNLIVAGLALALSRTIATTTQISVATHSFVADLFGGQIGAFHVSVVWWLLVLAIGAWVLSRTVFGNWILATGGDADRARRAGVPTARVTITLFICSALAAAFVGVLQAIEFDTGDATTGQAYVFQAPIVVVIGGVLLTGGYGTIVGVVLGTLIYGIVNAGLFYTGWNTDYAQVVIGVLMVVAVLTNDFIRKLATTPLRGAKGG